MYIPPLLLIELSMALSIKSAEADALARQVAALTGETLTEAITESLRLRLAGLQRRPAKARLLAIAEQGRNLPRLDQRDDQEILGMSGLGPL